MSRSKFALGSAAGLLLVLGTLGACDQSYPSSDRSAHQDADRARTTTAKVAKNAERAARDVSASVTAVAKGVEQGVREGVRQGQSDARSRQAYNDRSQSTTTTTTTRRDRSPGD